MPWTLPLHLIPFHAQMQRWFSPSLLYSFIELFLDHWWPGQSNAVSRLLSSVGNEGCRFGKDIALAGWLHDEDGTAEMRVHRLISQFALTQGPIVCPRVLLRLFGLPTSNRYWTALHKSNRTWKEREIWKNITCQIWEYTLKGRLLWFTGIEWYSFY